MAEDTLVAARDAARRLLETGVLLGGDWRDLSREQRQRLAGDVTVMAGALRRTSMSDTAGGGPHADAVREELRAPSAEVYLQPIVRLPTRRIVGYEALSRFPRWGPDRWFREAWNAGLGLELELAAVGRAVDCLGSLPADAFLGINVSASTLVSQALMDRLADVDTQRVVLELTEHEPILDYRAHCDQIDRLRERGIRIAIDDVGAGHSSLMHIVQLRPDVIKLDRALIAGCDLDGIRRVLMRCFATLARQARAALVAEGVENEREAEALAANGVRLAQGFLFGRPQAAPGVVPEAASL